jgi:hypothetical protein
MTLPDNRIHFPAAKIDFSTDVGVTSQDHDSYPPPQGQARFDHMRMFLIGLLAQQASYDEPTQYRDGTPWFDLNDSSVKIRSGSEWKHLSDAISVQQASGVSTLSLTDFVTQVLAAIPNITPEVVFSGVCTNDNVTSIPIPESLRSGLGTESRPFVFVNGALIDPRNTRLEPGANPSTVVLVSDNLDTGDLFTVNIRYIPDATFYSQSVTAS